MLERLRESLSHTRRTLGLVWKSSHLSTLAMALATLVGAVVPLGVAYAGKKIVDAVVLRDRALTLKYVLVELAFVAALAVTQRGLGLVRSLLGARLGIDINVGILEKATRLDLRYFEDAEFYDKLTRARREASSRPVALVTESFQLVQSLITLAGFAVVLTRFSVLAVLALLIATLPATIAEMRYSKVAFRVRNWRSPESRRLLYLEYVLANDEHAKEVKLFGLGPLLLERYKALAEQFYDEDRGLAVKRAGVTHALSLLGTFTFYAAYASMAMLAASGNISLGEMTLYILAFRQGQQSFQAVLGSIGSMYEHNLYMSNLFAFSDLPLPTPPLVTKAPPGSGEGIRFENVGFRYPGKEASAVTQAAPGSTAEPRSAPGGATEPRSAPGGKGAPAEARDASESWALRGIDLTIGRGESLALVGENGAGKTTLIKLLTRLYEPTEGRILLDGRDLGEWPPDALRARIGVVFQDFNQYQLKVRENVGFGSIEHRDDEERVMRAAERGGADEVIAGLPGGLDASLGRWFSEGTELSGGQWQKVALARAFMREEADILVLDEPTAALDAEAEHAVFTRFRELAKGRTTIVISHRFPTVRMAQRIVVLERGAIVEVGNHEELVARKGKYARMFELQAEGYR